MSTDIAKTASGYRQILDDIQSCNCIRYAAYRTASKLRIIQKNLHLDFVGLTLIKRVFEEHRILSSDLYFTFSMPDFESILYDIFFAAAKIFNTSFDIDLSVNLTKILLLNVYQSSSSGRNENQTLMTVLEAKVGMVLLCRSPLITKHKYWFAELADHNVRLSRKRLSLLLNALLSFTDFLGEESTFSHRLLQLSLDSCFNKANASLGINESDYLSWVVQEPQILVWNSTFYRLTTSETIIHQTHCSVCGVHPIVGLRYFCLRCIGYNLCQMCFFTGRTSKQHKNNHVIREYCTKPTTYETTLNYLRGFINRLCGNKSQLQYLPLHKPEDTSRENIALECSSAIASRDRFLFSVDNTKNTSTDSAVSTFHGTNPDHELGTIISQIECEFKLIQDAVGKGCTNDIIQRHADFLKHHLARLKVLQSDLKHSERVTSTPMKNKLLDETDFSPLNNLTNGTSNEYGTFDMFVQHASSSGFSAWVEEAGGLKPQDDSYGKHLEKELDIIMDKLNKMLESSFACVPSNDEEKL